jgi:chorismate mutase
MKLDDIRKQISHIDRQILERLNQRMSLSLQVKKLKSKIKDPKREIQVLNQINKETNGFDLVRRKFAKKIFKKIIRESRKIQKNKQKEES